MKRGRAGQLGTQAADFYVHHEEFSRMQANAINTALSLQAAEFLPERTVAAVVERADGLPLILAADDHHLYTVEAVQPAEDPPEGPATTRAEMRRLDPERCHVAAETRYRRGTIGMVRLTTWRIRVDDLELTIPTRVDEDGEIDDRERLAQHLAAAIGWRFDGNSEETAFSEAA